MHTPSALSPPPATLTSLHMYVKHKTCVFASKGLFLHKGFDLAERNAFRLGGEGGGGGGGGSGGGGGGGGGVMVMLSVSRTHSSVGRCCRRVRSCCGG